MNKNFANYKKKKTTVKHYKKTTRFLNGLLTTLILTQISTPVFAASTQTDFLNKNDIQIEAIDSNSLSIENFENKDIVTINENNNIRTITITNSLTGQNDYIIHNQNTNTVYSSILDKTINLNENKDLDPNAPTIATRAEHSYRSKYISYAQIQSVVGSSANTATVIGAILFFVPGAKGISATIGSISTIVSKLNDSVSASSYHGIKLKIKTTKYYRTRLGRRQVYRTTRSITSCEFY